MVAARRYLLLSGVNISRKATDLAAQEPYPDYLTLRNTFPMDVLDVETIRQTRSPMLRAIAQRAGPHWALAVEAARRSRQYAAVVATGEDVGLPYALLTRILRRRVPLIVICHNISGRRQTLYLQWLRLGARIALFQCLSTVQAAMLRERYGIRSGQLQIIAWHVDSAFFRPDNGISSHSQICSAGMAKRDYATLIRAVDGLDVNLKIAADSPWFREHLNIALDALPPRIEVRSYKTYAALRRLYAESRFVVVPLRDVDHSAGYSVILEAMAMGKAVIVSRIRQQDDFVIDGYNGYYVPPGDVVVLRARIQYLLNHPEEACRMGNRGRELVEARFTLDHFARQVEEALTRVGAPRNSM